MKLPYIIAVVAAIAIAAVIINLPNANDASTSNVDGQTLTSAVLTSPGTMTVAVPEMHCQYSCFPRVKETLESSDTVEMVELAPQADPTMLDDRSVIVHYKSGFNPDDAIAKLTQEGFADSTVVQ